MVKGISRQVILVQNPDRKLFEQAIFILKEDALGTEGVTEEMLLKEARKAAFGAPKKPVSNLVWGLLGALCGAFSTGAVWALVAFFS